MGARSYNFTTAMRRKNAENVALLTGGTAVERYQAAWQETAATKPPWEMLAG